MAEKAKKEPSVLAEDLRDILTRSIEGNLQLLSRVSGLVRDAAGAITAGNARSPQQPGELANRLVRLNLSYLSLLSKHGLAFADELTTVTERTFGLKTTATTEATRSPSTAPRVEINLNARVGDTAAGAFMVENTQQETLNVSFEASEIFSVQSEPIRSAGVRFDPPRLDLRPGLQAMVKVSIEITPEFKSGERYLFRIRLVGFEQKEVWIGLNILPPTEAPAKSESISAHKASKVAGSSVKKVRKKSK